MLICHVARYSPSAVRSMQGLIIVFHDPQSLLITVRPSHNISQFSPSELHLSFIPERPVLCVSANGIIYTESGSSAIADVTIAAMAIDTIISFGFILLGGELLQCRGYSFYLAILIKFHFINAHFSVEPGFSAHCYGIRKLESMVNNPPFIFTRQLHN